MFVSDFSQLLETSNYNKNISINVDFSDLPSCQRAPERSATVTVGLWETLRGRSLKQDTPVASDSGVTARRGILQPREQQL